MKVQELALPLVHNTDLNTMGARVTVVVYEKYFTGADTLLEEQTAFVSPQTTRRLLMGKRGSAFFAGSRWTAQPPHYNASK